jgi:GTP-binding protein
MALQIVEALFLKSATKESEWPVGSIPEVAFVGRSNVGKSSMLNRLTKHGKLARVSNTPGRTRLLQFFEVAFLPSPAAKPVRVRFCDLPGYGFAKVAKSEQAEWAKMIEEYLTRRQSLRTVVLIVDIRHPPPESDQQALEFLRQSGRDVLVAATKADKLAKSHRLPALRQVERTLGLPRDGAVLFSAEEGTGADALWTRIKALAMAPKEPTEG